MALELAKVWAEIAPLIKDGISLIPVRDKADGNKLAKTPFGSWVSHQEKAMTDGELFHAMEHYDTTAVGAVCGKISGNLECIDIDSKYKPGIDAILLQDLSKFYPHLFNRLRIHRTPSGGYHIVYRIVDHAPEGNLKLAGRYSSEEELQVQRDRGVKRPSKTINFLETRGEGGYFLYPPSLGYTVHQNNPIPLLSWEERCSLINLCRSYDEVVKLAPAPKPTQAQESYYTTNPFEDFNFRCDPIQLMESQGWNFLRENARFIWFTRPGKDEGVSASFNREKRVFYIFTTSTDLEGTKGYNPATLYSEFTHNGDKSAAFKALINEGYGQVKKSVEQAIIKKAVVNGHYSVPNNFSAEAKEKFVQLQQEFAEQHPYGIFWEYDDKGKIQISREDFLNVAHKLGFRMHSSSVVQINERFIERVSLIEFLNAMKEYIQEEEVEVYTAVANSYEKFIQASGKFIAEHRLEKFDDSECVQDSIDVCYKFYNNVAVRITPQTISVLPYDKIEGYIWSDKMLGRNYLGDEVVPSPLYENFLKNATGANQFGKVNDHVRNIIGYLTHDFKSEAAGYIVVMQEMVSDPRLGGGSGKNIFGNLLRNMITMCTVPGSSVQFNEKFLQAWNHQRIYFLADIPKRIDWLFLKEQATGFGLLKKLYKNEEEIAPEYMPKILINTNYSYEDSDGGLRRRIIPIEFTDFYTQNGGVDTVHGKMFPSGFTQEDWKGFDQFIIACIQYHLQQGGKLYKQELSQIGWEKKFANQYGEKTFEFFLDNIVSWVYSDYVEVSVFQQQYDSYVATDLKEKYKLSQRSLNTAIREFCERFGLEFQQSIVKKITHQTKRVHIFSGDVSVFATKLEDELPF